MSTEQRPDFPNVSNFCKEFVNGGTCPRGQECKYARNFTFCVLESSFCLLAGDGAKS